MGHKSDFWATVGIPKNSFISQGGGGSLTISEFEKGGYFVLSLEKMRNLSFKPQPGEFKIAVKIAGHWREQLQGIAN